MAKAIGGSPFVVGRYAKRVAHLVDHRDQIVWFFDSIVALDLSLKQGKVDESSFWPTIKSLVLQLPEVKY